MKNFYLAVTAQENGKYYSYVIRYANCNNLLATLKQHPSLISVNVCDSKKQAEGMVEAWNKQYKANGTYLFD